MARCDEIRAVMASLLTPETEAAGTTGNLPLWERRSPVPANSELLPLPGRQQKVFSELCAILAQNGIEANPAELAAALLDSLAQRPALCRSLLAAYLTQPV